MSVNDLDKGVLEKLKNESRVEGYLGLARVLERKAAVKEFVSMWCEATTRGEGAEFETLLRMDSKR